MQRSQTSIKQQAQSMRGLLLHSDHASHACKHASSIESRVLLGVVVQCKSMLTMVVLPPLYQPLLHLTYHGKIWDTAVKGPHGSSLLRLPWCASTTVNEFSMVCDWQFDGVGASSQSAAYMELDCAMYYKHMFQPSLGHGKQVIWATN